MKTVLIISLQLILVQLAWAQLDYYPEKHPDLDDKQYRKGIHILENTYSQIKNNDKEYTYGDYWNMMYGYIILKEPKEKVLEYLTLSKQLNEQNFSYIFTKASADLFKPYLSKADYEEMLKAANEPMKRRKFLIPSPILTPLI